MPAIELKLIRRGRASLLARVDTLALPGLVDQELDQRGVGRDEREDGSRPIWCGRTRPARAASAGERLPRVSR
jgi:hypothetical protein